MGKQSDTGTISVHTCGSDIISSTSVYSPKCQGLSSVLSNAGPGHLSSNNKSQAPGWTIKFHTTPPTVEKLPELTGYDDLCGTALTRRGHKGDFWSARNLLDLDLEMVHEQTQR